jgi:CBS domain-containing protein
MCKPSDDVRWALDIMAENKVRRLVVVNDQNQLEGILSMDDVVLYAETQPTGKPDISADDVLRTLKGLYSPQLSARAAAAHAKRRPSAILRLLGQGGPICAGSAL